MIRRLLILLLGLAAGVGLGLFLGWYAWPTEYADADPTLLAEAYRYDYVVMIAAAYSADHDLPSASQRLRSAWIGASDPFQEYLAFTVEAILEGGNEADMRHLARLATDLGLSSPALAPYLIDD
ncbi:MAG: hypothetical protein KA314_16860 [Chloroflexi bacterium]|nr:hypothetical protein [Chloroflexota bacterium]MBP8057504.1 hypothetical protein [Chloroflexota bacterium]